MYKQDVQVLALYYVIIHYFAIYIQDNIYIPQHVWCVYTTICCCACNMDYIAVMTVLQYKGLY